MQNTLIVIAGPTAVGKTDLSIEIAQKLDTEIISADSRQIYRELTIGTAKPDTLQLSLCTHHLVNHKSIYHDYTAAQYGRDAQEILVRLFHTKPQVILCGGSGLYIDALCQGFDNLPESNTQIRNEFAAIYKHNGLKALQELLVQVDYDYSKKVDMNNPHRIIRALEVNKISGHNMAFFQKGNMKLTSYSILYICVNLERKILYERINQRVDKMISEGLEDEALAYYHLRNLNSLQTVGYKEFFDYFEGKTSYDEAVEKIKQNTRNYAKRQLTWFRRNKAYQWFDIESQKEQLWAYIYKNIELSSYKN